MKIAVISDIHDNLANLERCLEICARESAEEMICCGDVANDETLSFLSVRFPYRINLVRGNMELYAEDDPSKYGNIDYYGRTGRKLFGGVPVGFCHEPFLLGDVLKKGGCDFVFYGHTHRPWIERKGRLNFVNPGNLAGTRHMATFAIWDTEKDEPELKVL